MTTARDDILGRIRAALEVKRGAATASAKATGAPRVQTVRPPAASSPIEQFSEKALGNGFTITRVAHRADLAAAVGHAVDTHVGPTNQTRDISISGDLSDLAWPSSWQINSGKGRLVESVGVTQAIGAIAETGSLVFASTGQSPATLNYLPDLHIAVLPAATIVAYPEDLWARMRASGGVWPRALNIVSGASRTADVAGIIVKPAHGPKHVHIIIEG
ncbi:MAG: LutC/YkgG family protein [Hyphomicrobium sp.]